MCDLTFIGATALSLSCNHYAQVVVAYAKRWGGIIKLSRFATKTILRLRSLRTRGSTEPEAG
ncbi:MAG: hypothetical protein ACE5GV_01660 [Candidatus Scalindua sp.]